MGEYNGWTNYETWLVKLWLDNDQGTYYDVTGHATETVTATDGVTVADKYDFADWVQEYVEELLPDIGGLAADLMKAALSEVNWREIAEGYLDDAASELAHS